GLGLAVGGVAGLIGIVGTVAPKITAFRDALMNMGSAGQFVGRNLGLITGVLGGVAAALGIYTLYLGRNAREQAEAEAAANSYTEAIKEQGAAVGEATDALALKNIVKGEIGQSLRDAGAD